MAEVLISIKEIHRFYGDFEALKGISLKVEKGQIFGYLGPNGSGKTTTIKLILGLIKPSFGTVRVHGGDPYHDNDMNVRINIGSMLELDGLYEKLTGLENVIFWAELFGITGSKAVGQAKKVIKLVEMSEWAHVLVSKYSFGMRKRLALARALISDPDILILDEPTVGVDPETRYLIRKMMKDLASQGKTIFFSSHDLEEIQKTCTHVAIIKKGKLISNGALNDVLAQFGKPKLFIRLESASDTETLGKKLEDIGYQIHIEGPLISFYPKNDLNIDDFSKYGILDSWKVESSLEEVYLNLVRDKRRKHEQPY
ncbi:ABC transporter ATP-binding protein [Methanobacterium sp.]|uniref:ABC transporter ATP-binding protein n=1 Tax=Methanobacterium sp. TaxID=2164 RepID=UPI0026005A01|nr:ABC transporter ATP-binding protein [Methanobacterium sp.]MBI5460159.1 ABC transporter ATP-binding protein [Methanobacterium sp.]